MTPRHVGQRLNVAEFAKRAGIKPPTLRGYMSRPIEGHPVPEPCWRASGVRGMQWCERHADLWINNRSRKQNGPTP